MGDIKYDMGEFPLISSARINNNNNHYLLDTFHVVEIMNPFCRQDIDFFKN